MPIQNYSIFSQDKVITVHRYLFEICYTVQQMELNHFLTSSYISHKVHNQDLMKWDQCDLVKSVECGDVELKSKHEQVLEMESCIADDWII